MLLTADSERQLRIRALELAVQHVAQDFSARQNIGTEGSPKSVLRTARQFFSFLAGDIKPVAKSPTAPKSVLPAGLSSK
jgi:hypothetical protein